MKISVFSKGGLKIYRKIQWTKDRSSYWSARLGPERVD